MKCLFTAFFLIINLLHAKNSCFEFFGKSEITYESLIEQERLSRFKKITQNNKFQLKNTLNILSTHYKIIFREQSELFEIQHKTVYARVEIAQWIQKLPDQDLKQLITPTALIYQSSRNLGLSQKSSLTIAQAILKHSAQTIGYGTGKLLGNFDKLSFVSAMNDLISTYEVNKDFEIPYIAGYSSLQRRVYIDNDFKSNKFLPFLISHEIIESELLKLLPTEIRNYFIAHHIAQRIEMEFVRASDESWLSYQHTYIAAIDAIAYEKINTLDRIPEDLNLIPYREMDDLIVIERVPTTKVETVNTSELFSVLQIMPGVFHLAFHKKREMAKTLIRFQEYYESPSFYHRPFTRKEFQEDYRRRKGRFDYYTFWGDGFNFPGYVFESFFKGQFKYLTKEEKLLLKFFKSYRHSKFYVIATAKDSEGTTLDHEIAHALFSKNENYKKEILAALHKYNIKPVTQFLAKTYSDYRKGVLLDETHAWLMHNSADLQNDGFNIKPYQELIFELQEIYKRYKQ